MSSESLAILLLSDFSSLKNISDNLTIPSQIRTFLNAYLSSKNNSVFYFSSSSELVQISFRNDLQDLAANTRKIVFQYHSAPLLGKICKILCRFKHISNSKRILLISDTSTASLEKYSHRFVSLAYTSEKLGIVCDLIQIGSFSADSSMPMESRSQNCLSKLAQITSGLDIQIADGSSLLNVLFTCIGMNVKTRKELLPVHSISCTRFSASHCSCHSKPIAQGYLCPICMALYCSFVPVCKYCKVKFNF